MTKYWIAVASAEHVRRGNQGGFMQVNHGKAAPLRTAQSHGLAPVGANADPIGAIIAAYGVR